MKDGGMAFPSTWYDRDSMGEVVPREFNAGMTLRDYFAAKALAGAVAKDGCCHILMTKQVRDCWRIADEMLKAREASA